MAKSSDAYDGLSRTLSTLGAAVIFLLGLLLVVLSFLLIKDDNFQAMNSMIEADAAWAGEPALAFSLDKAAIGIVIIGCLSMIVAFVGCLGAQLEKHNLICTYFLCIVVLGMWFIIALVAVLNFDAILLPIADRQATQFCNVTQFYTFKAELGCAFPASRPGGSCGVDCKSRVSLLREMNGGCDLLEVMCHSYDWLSVGQGLCLTADEDNAGKLTMPPTWQSQAGVPMTRETCQKACNEHVLCSSFSFEATAQACFLVTRLSPTTHGTWTKLAAQSSSPYPTTASASPVAGSDGQTGYICSKKDRPTVVTKASAVARTIVWLSCLATLVLSLTMCCTCSLLYTTGTRRKGKKGAGPIMHKMLCPCCVGQAHRKFADEFEEDEFEEDAELLESDEDVE